MKLAREGNQMTAQHLRDLEPDRRYATLVAVILETKATIIDQIVDLHDRLIGALFNRAKRAHAEQFQQSARAINEKLRLYWRSGEALLEEVLQLCRSGRISWADMVLAPSVAGLFK